MGSCLGRAGRCVCSRHQSSGRAGDRLPQTGCTRGFSGHSERDGVAHAPLRKPTPTFLFGYGNGMIGGLGENGAEAIVPLEKNTEWMNVLANKLSERMGGNAPIVLQVDGKTFAQISVDSINQLTRQRGKLALNLM